MAPTLLHTGCPAATVVVFGLLPLQPQMLGKPERGYDGIIAAANQELAAFVKEQASPRLIFKGAAGGIPCTGCASKGPC